MPVPPDYFAYVGTAHFYLKDELFPLLLPGYQHLVGCIHQVLDYELEEIFHKLVLRGPASAGQRRAALNYAAGATAAAAAAAVFLRAFLMMLATVSLG